MKSIHPYFSIIALIFCFLFSSVSDSLAQVHIAPVALYMDESNRTGRMVLLNSSSEPVDVSIDMIFGYPASDDNGRIFMEYPDPIPDEEPSAAEWIRAYPRNLTLPAGERQTIRFAARPPADLQEGEYWIRPTITTSPVPQDMNSENEKISARINMSRQMVLSLNYRHKNAHTGVTIENASAEINDSELQLTVRSQRTGNAAFLGNIAVRIRAEDKRLVKELQREIAVYHSLTRRFEFGLEDLPQGVYYAEIELNTDREGENPGDILQAEKVTESVRFNVP